MVCSGLDISGGIVFGLGVLVVIDCDDCVVCGFGCCDCVVSVFIGVLESLLYDECVVLEVFVDVGLVFWLCLVLVCC